MWSDIETSKDLLGYTVHAELLKKIIMEPSNLPATIGLYGDWGCGKSSMLKILQEKIERDADSKENSIVIYFDGWSFESFDDAKMALIQGIVEKLESNTSIKEECRAKVKELSKTAKEKIFSMRTLLWSVKNIVAPAALSYATGGLAILPSLINFFESYNSDDKKKELADALTGKNAETFLKKAFNTHINVDQFSAVREFRKSFCDLIKATGKDRVVILIDDLDRCLPQHIIDNLEAIKLFLNVEKTAFLIAADQDIVSNAIMKQYGEKIGIEKRIGGVRSIGEDYMDKFIHIPYIIPKLSDQEVESYVTLLLCESVLSPSDFQAIHNDFQKYIIEHKFEGYGWNNIKEMPGVKENKELAGIVAFMAHCTTSISHSLYRNPRLIKRFLNAFEIRSQLLQLSGNFSETNKYLLLKLMLLETSHSILFGQLNRWTIENKGFSPEIKELEQQAAKDQIDIENYKDWDFKDVKELLTMEPYFSSCDLREIYWVSRDKLIDGMGGTTLIPERIKKLLKMIYSADTDSKMKQQCEEVKVLNGADSDSFFEMLDGKMLTDSEETTPYKVYYYLIELEIDGAYNRFIKTFSRIAEKAPFSISNYLKKLLDKFNNDKVLLGLIYKNNMLTRIMFPKAIKKTNK